MLIDQNKPLQLKTAEPIYEFISQLQRTYSQTYHIFPAQNWWFFSPKDHHHSTYKVQGWKLHVSTTWTLAISLLEIIAPFLIEQNVQWKVLLTLDHLIDFSSPPSPLSQLGKYITIYPDSDEIAVKLAELLHKKLEGLRGPVIPSDFCYAENSQVYYRYGGFKEQYYYHPRTSLRTPYLLTPNGQKIPDERTPKPHHPDWVNNPFPLFKPNYTSHTGLFGRGLEVCGVLGQSIKGGAYVVKNASKTFILKEARFGTCPDEFGRDARDRLTNEFNLLKKIEHLHIAPQPLDLFDAENNRYLLMEHLPGQTLRKYIEQTSYVGEDNPHFLRYICSSLIRIVKQCHNEGIILRDLSPNNILVTRTSCYLIDFELAHHISSEDPPFEGHTRGFVPLGTERLGRTEHSYDIYALGAVLYHMLTGAQAFLSENEDILPRLPELFDCQTFLKHVSLKDIATEAMRLLSTREWNHSDVAPLSTFALIRERDTPAQETDLPFSRDELLHHALAIADYLSNQADFTHPDRFWLFASPQSELYHPTSFYGGATGIGYFLWEIAQVTGRSEYAIHARQIVDWLYTFHPFVPRESPSGLYFGYAGLAWFSMLLAEGVRERHYLDQALALADQIAQESIVKFDLTHGMAGVGLMHLELFQRTGQYTQLAHAQRMADSLLELAQSDDQGGTIWQEEERTLWGLAHGSAGIAYFLLALYSQTHDPTLKEVIERANRALLQAAVPTAYGQGLSWPEGPREQNVAWTHWCHGASGIGTYLLTAARVLCDPQLEKSAVKAAQAIRLSSGVTSFCQCHGLAGEGEYLLQISRAFDLPEITQAVYKIVRKLYAFRLSVDGVPGFVWNNETLGQDPRYMTGYCGIYSFLLRIFYEPLSRPLLEKRDLR